jgi:hypothetical protein
MVSKELDHLSVISGEEQSFLKFWFAVKTIKLFESRTIFSISRTWNENNASIWRYSPELQNSGFLLVLCVFVGFFKLKRRDFIYFFSCI